MVCCDGTWKRADDVDVSNIEKIARAVAPVDADGKPQIVYYRAGVGTGGSKTERLVGGAFGIGLDSAIVDAYRFLALNYEKGDKVYVFGFSRGAYTARSLVGMIATIGLLKPQGVASGKLPKGVEAVPRTATAQVRIRSGVQGNPQWDKENEEFAPFCHEPVPIAFLGVFDTVGALGAPGPTRRRYRFHDVRLSEQVLVARQALAAAERRRAFAPCLWGRINADGGSRDVVQVWFDVCTPTSAAATRTAYSATGRWPGWSPRQPRPDWPSTSTGSCPTAVNSTRRRTIPLTVFYRIANVFSRFAAAYGRRMPSDLLKRFRRGWRNFAPMVDPSTPTKSSGGNNSTKRRYPLSGR